jgi:hypothetical protein
MSKCISCDEQPGIFPYSPDIDPEPSIEPDYNPDYPGEPHHPDVDHPKGPRRVQGRQKEGTDSIKEFGAMQLPEVKSNIHCLSIVGQIEGHASLWI